jgi:GNAT superfamily N-acetyltransferase
VIELRCYRKNEVPRDIAVQVASYVRVQWPGLLARRTPLWESTPYPADGVHFVIADGDALVSHALAHGRKLSHGGEEWNVWGLSSVFTYPAHRGGGFGEQVVAAATKHIRHQPGADLALLFCGERVKSLYLRQGWEHLPAIRVKFGDDQEFNDGHVMTLFVSGRARAHDFAALPIYVGSNTW